MPTNLQTLKIGKGLERFEATIHSAFDAGLADVREKLDLPSVEVVVENNPDSIIPETGVGGFAPSASRLEIYIDPSFERLDQSLDMELRSTLAHELHHCARWEACGYGETLLEEMVSEGLADHFDIEVNGNAPKPWSVALSEAQLKLLKVRALEESAQGNHDHDAWFFGSEEQGIPRWAAYSLGFSLVGAYIDKTGRKASELVGEKASVFTE